MQLMKTSEKPVGFAAQLKLDQANMSSTYQRVFTFKRELGEFLAGLLLHFLEKSSLKFIIVRTAVSINLIQMANQSKRNACIDNFSIAIAKIV